MEPDLSTLPEGCIAHALSLTSPRDVCTASAVCRTFHSAAGSDAVWERFLPSDYGGILSRAVTVEEVAFGSKKELFSRLCRPLLIDGGGKNFVLDKSTGKKCFMLSAREVDIIWGDTPEYWNWTSHPKSRFSEVAELLDVCWLEISGTLKSSDLSTKTTYVAYLIFQLRQGFYGLDCLPQEGIVTVGAQSSREIVSLTPRHWGRGRMRMGFPSSWAGQLDPDVIKHFARRRSDGWMELSMGEFFNEGGLDEVVMSLLEIRGGHWKSGLIVEGIELRPKN